MSTVDEVKQKTDIVALVSQYVSLTKTGKNLRALCPFHSEKSPSFFVYPERQSWHCFGACSTGGDVFSFVMKKESITFGEALRLLADRAGVVLPSRAEQKSGEDERKKLYQVNREAAQYFNDLLLNSPAAEKARGYINSRGLLQKTTGDFLLGYSLNSREALKQCMLKIGYTEADMLKAGLLVEADDGKTYDRFRNQLMFPIFDDRDRVTGFGARVLDDSLPKYINSPQTRLFDKSGNLYGVNLAKAAIRQQNMVIIVEGYMDALMAHQNAFQNVVASMGTSITEKQIDIIKKLTSNVALALDADAAGEEAMLRCVGYENDIGAEMKVIVLPEGKDPDDVIKHNPDDWQRLVGDAVPVIDYAFSKVSAGIDLSTARGKSLVVEKLGSVVAEIKDDIRRAHYLNKLARLANTNSRNVEAAIAGMKPQRNLYGASKISSQSSRPSASGSKEEYCLALLLQHPELKACSQHPLPEYFEDTENRELFLKYMKTDSLESLRQELGSILWEHIDYLLRVKIPATQLETRYEGSVLRLREEYLRDLEKKKGEALALEAEVGGTAAELAKLEEQGIDVSVQLREIFMKKIKGTHGNGGAE